MFLPKPLGQTSLPKESLKIDKKESIPYGLCGLGNEALYLGRYIISKTHYIPLKDVKRVFKRLAVSKGFYENKVFGSISYLVVLFDDNREKVYKFEHERDLDLLLDAIRKKTQIPVGKV